MGHSVLFMRAALDDLCLAHHKHLAFLLVLSRYAITKLLTSSIPSNPDVFPRPVCKVANR